MESHTLSQPIDTVLLAATEEKKRERERERERESTDKVGTEIFSVTAIHEDFKFVSKLDASSEEMPRDHYYYYYKSRLHIFIIQVLTSSTYLPRYAI